MDDERQTRERRRAAYLRASKAHKDAARVEASAADFYESRGETDRAARHRALAEQQLQWAQDDADRAAQSADDGIKRES